MAYTEQEARALIIEAGHRLLQEKLIARTWGNISARISDTQFIITPSGRAYDTLRPEDLVKVNVKYGTAEGNYKPSSEKGIHAAAYQLRKDVDFVIHTHQFYASAICAAGEDAPFAPCAAYGLPGTKKLKNAVAKVIRDNPRRKAFLMARHGAVCLGTSYDDAFNVVENLESQCKMLFESRVTMDNAPLEDTLSLGNRKTLPFVRWESDPISVTWSHRGAPLCAYIDDFAQMVGYYAPVCKTAPQAARRLKHHSAAVLTDRGALCTADNAGDALAVSMIMQKNCAAALYAAKSRPMSVADAMLQRAVYLKKYSKQKDA